MTNAEVVRLATDALLLVLTLSAPAIIVATVVGLLVSLIQAITQIQEQTLSFAAKLACVSVVLVGTAGWLGSALYRYTERLFASIPHA
ncbi:type III secretion system export apparatus subunit SctS [Belnapia sp. T18]|uniref:Type III secretion system export apparatus subunit SctS n=1 Tax=Belnapia arida TaxID=2804533 RepID=A0ABS1U5R7_9PROT|nr:type III secretion system export apparatus subunit SctS [Belnapia arida]MBL6080030.1 type III secretion system export apparatus subunit SctS [Belnapia arida]